MSKTLQFRRDTTTNLANTIGAQGELFVDTVKNTVVVNDGARAGGYPLAKEDEYILLSGSAIDLSLGSYFKYVVASSTTFTVSNFAASGTVTSFVLEIQNGGSNIINWWTGIQWPGGVAPSLTPIGKDALGFYSYDGGNTWTGVVIGKDIR